jgi:Holliday junction resolvase RusA-like endonuclease
MVDSLQSKAKREIIFSVYGQPYSKANSRKLVTIGGKPSFIKSAPARRYVTDFQAQCPKMDPLMEGDLEVQMVIFYASRRPDLDPSLILDCMENKIYKNDRQVKRQILYWGLDKKNPRAEIRVTEIEIKNPQQPPRWKLRVMEVSEELTERPETKPDT